MSDEIKKILQKIENVANRETACRNALMEMKDKDYQLLLDYITNLQEENRKLKKEKDALMNSLFITRNKYNNDKARYRRKAKNYKTRNEKAIEYIKGDLEINEKYKKEQEEPLYSKAWVIDTYSDLLNILQGKSDE